MTDLFPRTASTDFGATWFKRENRWSEYPAIGAQVFYGVGSDMNHTGLVYDYDGTYIYTIEGNTNASGSREGDGVYAKKRRRRDSYVRGYGYPAYPEGIKSADPKWAHAAPKPTAKPKGKGSPTRGGNVDSALSSLGNAKPSKKNHPKVQAAIKALRSIKPWKK